jgi:N6-adenosine-specific RNA methylase IME4
VGKYRTILADPPWSTNQTGKLGAGRHYPLMTLQEICKLSVGDLAEPDSHLWLWVTNNNFFEASQVMTAWGFSYRSCLTWIKPRFGLGNYLWNQTEHLLPAANNDK